MAPGGKMAGANSAPGDDLLDGLLTGNTGIKRKRGMAVATLELHPESKHAQTGQDGQQVCVDDGSSPLSDVTASHYPRDTLDNEQQGNLNDEDRPGHQGLNRSERLQSSVEDHEARDEHAASLTETIKLGTQQVNSQMQLIQSKVQQLSQLTASQLDTIKEHFTAELDRFIQGLHANLNTTYDRWCDLSGETIHEGKRLDMAKDLVGSLGLAAGAMRAENDGHHDTNLDS